MHTIFTHTVEENVYFELIMFNYQGETFQDFLLPGFFKGEDFWGLFRNKKHCMQMMSRGQIGM